MTEYKSRRTCSKCDKPFYASYKGKYYCPIHLEEILAKEKKALREMKKKS